MESLFVVTAVAGATELIRRAYVKDWVAVATILVSVLIGVLASLLNLVANLNVANGVMLGLGASGFVTVASRVGGNAAPKEPVK